MDLSVFFEPKIDLPRITHILDGLGPMGRLETINGWDGLTLQKLFDAAQGYRPMTAEHLVPASIAPGATVIHKGKNSMSAFAYVEKHFARPPAGREEGALVVGYNVHPWASWTGPGYFVGVEGKMKGEILLDYGDVPDEELIPRGWPAVVSNRTRLGRFVFDDMVDRLRALSNHVAVGYANNKYNKTWFALNRIDPD